MIFCTNKTFLYRRKRKERWHNWFAWFPVTLEVYQDGSKVKAWLTTVQRKGTLYNYGSKVFWTYKYKAKPRRRNP